MNKSVKYVANSFFWSSIAKILNATLKFISIPLLLTYFGKDNYGLITLAIATNAYMQLLNMGMNTGAVKFFSQWIVAKDFERINRVARTNITFYASLGIINSILLLTLAWKGGSVFKISPEEFITFRYLLFILAGVSIFNWCTFVFTQLLIADEKMAYTQKTLSFRSILNLVVVLLTIHYNWSIIQYFLYDSIVNMLVIVPYYWKSKKRDLIQSIIPGFYWKDFSIVFKYSLAIFAMSIFQFTAINSRPIILGMFSNQGASILSDYRVIEVFPMFIISIGGGLISILLPKSSQAIHQKDRFAVDKIAYEGTKYSSILVSLLCFPIILNAKQLLVLYVGDSYAHLSVWLTLWVFTLTLSLHNSPVASLVLATGKTRMLVYSSAIACIVSIIINSLLVNHYGVGSAVLGYLIYIIIQISFYYLYFNNKILDLKSAKVFTAYFKPTLIAGVLAFLVSRINLNIELHSIIEMVARSLCWLILFIITLFSLKVVSITTIRKTLLNR